MKKAIIISDSFKGSISSEEIVALFKESASKIYPELEVVGMPISDGGEGMVECLSTVMKGEFVSLKVRDPYFDKIESKYYISEEGIAFIELASAAGITLVKDRNPSVTSTYGVGEEIKDAISRGVKHIVLGLGGSATNDGGCGLACALGTKFINKEGKEFIPTGGNLNQIESIDNSETYKLLEGIQVEAMCDVKVTLYGPNGAAYIFAPQKGADLLMVRELDYNLRCLAKKIKECLNIEVDNVIGGGAAGGVGAGVIAFLNASLRPGIDSILEVEHFDDRLKDCDIVFTGEGNIDSQSVLGKVISGIIKITRKHHIPVIAICGGANSDVENIVFENKGLNAIFTTTRRPMRYEELVPYSKEFYKNTINNVLLTLKIGEQLGKKY